MTRLIRGALGLALSLILIAGVAQADEFLENLQPDQVVYGFRTVSLYDDASGQAMGARFISEKNGYIIDLLQIQSVPQAFYWIKTPVTASRGEPHACEHLLLGKGNRGRYVAALEDMALGNSTAYTAQYRTAYHFNTTAGEDTFYEIYEAKLQALLHPDFSDEEIRREVCHIGVVEDPQTGELSIDEKGTVYTEMVSALERPYYSVYGGLYNMVYGESHPLTHNSGGNPDVMRSMVPQDMWDFHAATHHLSNMGSIVSIPASIPVDSYLLQMSEMLDRCQEYPDSSRLSGIGNYDFPPPSPAPVGTSKLLNYPSDRADDPGYLLYAWPADLELDYHEQAVLDLFLEVFGSGETSDLYDVFINSETAKIKLGASAVDGWIEDDFGIPISFDLTGCTSSRVNQTTLDSALALILDEVRRVHQMPAGSDELADFNTRARNRIIEYRKQSENNLNQPPMFGFRRGPAGAWTGIMADLEKVEGFRKSLVFDELFGYVDSLLNLDVNIWTERIDTWRLLTIPPYSVGATPGLDIIATRAAEKEARLATHIEDFKSQYGTDDAQAAMASYKAEFDAKTAELDAKAANDKIPGFIDNPPMTLDDQLDYQTIELASGIPMVASTFENMSSSRIGLALRLDVIPESQMMYVPFLTSVMTSIGVVKDGEIVTFSDMQERLRQEVLQFNAYNSYGMQQGRVELVLAGEGASLDELRTVIDWMDAALFSPYLSVDNLSRIRDRIDQLIQRNRNQRSRSEESWVRSPADAYRFQDNPLIMSAGCFLTRTHHLQRLRWQMTDPGDAAAQAEITGFIGALETYGAGKSRVDLTTMLTALEGSTAESEEQPTGELFTQFAQLSEGVNATIRELAVSLRATLSDIPDANLEADWKYLCTMARDDILVPPATVLDQFKDLLALVARTDNVRMFVISNTANREGVMDKTSNLIGKLGNGASVHHEYASKARINERLASREADLTTPVYVGLVHEGTQNGVLIFNARVANEYDTTTNAMLNCLSGKLFGGGGPHGLFMRTWAAGLAYSNGYGYSQSTGRVAYYAERCPDVAETMRFVVSELSNAANNPALVDYAIAQVFGASRAPNRYEARGEAMAANLTDGVTPEKVRTFREEILKMKTTDGLYTKLQSRMEDAYGPVMIGFGKPVSESNDGNFFLIGPEPQFESLENLIETVESKHTVYRLYPRDFWLTI